MYRWEIIVVVNMRPQKLLLTLKDCPEKLLWEIIGSYHFVENNRYIVNATNYYES
jgi:hypothetical protein